MKDQDGSVLRDSEAWTFKRNENNRWVWDQSVDGKIVKQSESDFGTSEESEADAIKHGKPNWPYIPTAFESNV